MKRFVGLIVFGSMCFLVCSVSAQVTGPCSSCHSMHQSQDGDHMILNEAIDGTTGAFGAFGALTRGTCVGCHTGTNTGGTYPYVYSISEPNYGADTLAGGNFYWATQDDKKGHNVKGIPAMTVDSNLSAAPGDQHGCQDSCHLSLYDDIPQATGCEGCHLEPKHHATQQIVGAPALEVNGYFRFLSGHMSGAGNGVEGIEDDDWQFTVNASDHNEYLGSDGNVANANTMSNYCIGCHGNFHVQQDTNNEWIRHPSDAVIPNSGEYAAYVLYDPNVPVARPSLTGITSHDIVNPGQDMVMCISCHRAHGSPYDDMLRWEYDGMVAGNGGIHSGTGCFKCHSEKD